MNKPLASLLMGIFLVLWTGITGFAAGAFAVGTWPQLRTYGFAETTGTVTRSELVPVGKSPRKKSVTLEVEYSYQVNETNFVGRRYAYGSFGSNTKMWSSVQETVPLGAVVPVYYSVNDPADAVLYRGLMGFHLFVPWALMPFVIVAVGGWGVLLRANRPQFHPGRIEQTASGWRVRLPEFGRAAVFLLTALIVSFVGLFAIVFGLGTNPPIVVMVASYVILFAIAMAAAVKWARYPMLEVDSDRRVVVAPDRREVPFGEIKEIQIRSETIRTRNSRTPTTNYHVTVVKRDDGLVRVGQFNDMQNAEALIDWLNDRIAGRSAEA
jgi:hypothetical protein